MDTKINITYLQSLLNVHDCTSHQLRNTEFCQNLIIGDIKNGIAAIKLEGRWGFVDSEKNIVIPPIYEKFLWRSENYFLNDQLWVKYKGRFGKINRQGEIILPLQYEDLQFWGDKNNIIVRQQGYSSLISNSGEKITIDYDAIEPFNNHYANVILKGKHHIINTNGDVVLKNSSIESTDYGFYIYKSNNKYGLLDLDFNIQISARYDDLIFLENRIRNIKNIIRVSIKNKYGLIDSDNKILLPIKYDHLETWINEDNDYIYMNYAAPIMKFEHNDKKGIVTINDKNYFEQQFSSVDSSWSNRINVSKNDKHGIIDGSGNIVIPLDYSSIDDFREGISIFKKNNKSGMFDSNHNILVSPIYDEIDYHWGGDNYFFGQGLKVRINDLWGVINKKGELIVPVEYENIDYAFVNEFVVTKKGKSGVLNSLGKILIPLQYDRLHVYGAGGSDAHEGGFYMNANNNEMYEAESNGKKGFITPNHIILPLIYDDIGLPNQGFIKALKNNYFGLISHRYEIAIPFEYDEIHNIHGEQMIVKKGQFYGVIDTQNKSVIPIEYDDLVIFRSHPQGTQYIVKKNNKYGIINDKLQEIIPFEYEGFFSTGSLQTPIQANKIGLYNFERSNDYKFPILARKNKLYGQIGENNSILIPFISDEPFQRRGDLFIYTQNRKLGIVYNAQHISEAIYTHIEHLGDEIYSVKIQNWEIINSNGVSIVPPKYEHIVQLSEELGLYAVKKRHYAIYNAESKKLLSDFKYTYIYPIYKNIMMVSVFQDSDFINERQEQYLPDFSERYSYGRKHSGSFVDQFGNLTLPDSNKKSDYFNHIFPVTF